jgi:hypothetical protein
MWGRKMESKGSLDPTDESRKMWGRKMEWKQTSLIFLPGIFLLPMTVVRMRALPGRRHK